jgi:hypothetical protein
VCWWCSAILEFSAVGVDVAATPNYRMHRSRRIRSLTHWSVPSRRLGDAGRSASAQA